jgi:Nucleotidyltransferase domain
LCRFAVDAISLGTHRWVVWACSRERSKLGSELSFKAAEPTPQKEPMQEPEIRKLLSKLRRGLEGLYGERLEGMYHFGSWAREEATQESDVDILGSS